FKRGVRSAERGIESEPPHVVCCEVQGEGGSWRLGVRLRLRVGGNRSGLIQRQWGEGDATTAPQSLQSPQTFAGSGCTHGARYDRRKRRLASSSPITCPFAGSQFRLRPSRIERLARMHEVV